MSEYISISQIIERNAQAYNQKISLYTNDGRYTWGQTRHRIACVAKSLTDHGISVGDRVAVLALNSQRTYESYFAPLWLGGVTIPLNTRWSVSEISYALKDSEAKVLVFDDTFLKMVSEYKETDNSIQMYVYIGEETCPEWAISFDGLVNTGVEMARIPKGGEDLAFIMYTGGTTGHPKGVMLSHTGIYMSSLAWAVECKISTSDTYLHAAPMFHAADFGASLASTIQGAAHVFIPGFEPGVVFDAIGKYQVTSTLLVPTMIKLMLNDPRMDKADFSSFTQMMYGASPMPEGVLLNLIDKLPHVGLFQVYGQTELSPLATVLSAEHHTPGNALLRSAGRPIFCDFMRIRKEDGSLASVGEAGEVEVSGPNIMLGYLNKPDVTSETLVDGYVRTGDVGYLNEEGFLFIGDRLKDMIVTGAENVFSAEVESAISLHPSVKEVAVIGIPHEKWGESVHAIIILHDEKICSELEIIQHTKTHITSYKCPKTVEFTTEPFPVSAAGKTQKVEIRKPYWSEKGRLVN